MFISLTKEDFLTEKETAAVLNMQPNTLAIWRSQGRKDLKYCRFGRSIRYRKVDILKFIEACTVGGDS